MTSLIKWEPFRDIERIFEEDFPLLRIPKQGFDLAVDVYEEGNKVIAEMNLPGIDPDQASISVEDGILRISGSREEEKETNEKSYHSKEIRRGSFERALRLPCAVKADAAEAEYRNGVLKITMPKEETAEKIRIKVRN